MELNLKEEKKQNGEEKKPFPKIKIDFIKQNTMHASEI
jgi:hypothetical protein